MKRISIVFLCGLFLLGAMTGCVPRGSGHTDSKVKITVCIEEHFESDMDQLLKYLAAIGNTVTYDFEVIPAEGDARDNTLQRIRGEIMAGKGPDVFIMDSPYSGSIFQEDDSIKEEPVDFLFTDPTRLMANGIFLDISNMTENSDIVDIDNCVSAVMDTGVYCGSRYILPLRYTFISAVEQKDKLDNSSGTFFDIEALLNTDTYYPRNFFSTAFPQCFTALFGDLADYESGEIVLTENKINAVIQDCELICNSFFDSGGEKLNVLEHGEEPSMEDKLLSQGFGAVTEGLAIIAEGEEFGMAAHDIAVIPMPNVEGGVTAFTVQYAAINANTEFPEESFQFIELLLHDNLQGDSGFVVTDGGEERVYLEGAKFEYGQGIGYGVPVKQTVVDEIFEGATEYTVNSYKSAVERINVARFPTAIDIELRNMITNVPYGGGKWEYIPINDVLLRMQMRVDE